MKVIEFNLKQHFTLVKSFFLRIINTDPAIEKNETVWQRALNVYSKIIDNISLKVAYKHVIPKKIEGKELVIDNITISCNAFEILNQTDVISSFIYMMTIGECKIDSKQILDQLYCDAWGTAFIDAGRVLFKKHLINETEEVVSESFGPGYYGMNVSELNKFFNILNADILNLHINQYGMMVPEKSNAGIFLELKQAGNFPSLACESCKGNPLGCHFCNIFIKT